MEQVAFSLEMAVVIAALVFTIFLFVSEIIRIDLAAFQLERDGEVHALSPKEAGMLALLRAEQGKAVRREKILDQVWGTEQFVGPRTVDTHMLNLRQKLEPDPKVPRYLLTVHRVGYRLVDGGADAPP